MPHTGSFSDAPLEGGLVPWWGPSDPCAGVSMAGSSRGWTLHVSKWVPSGRSSPARLLLDLAPRSPDQFSAAVRAREPHVLRTGFAESAFEGAYVGNGVPGQA